MTNCICINDPTLQALAELVVRHGTAYNGGLLYSLPTGEWDAEVDFHPVFGNHLSLSERAGPRRLIWSFTDNTCDYRKREGQPSKQEARAVAATVLELARQTDDAKDEGDGRELYWWLAVNGASCAASHIPFPRTVKVHPTPEQLIGFRTREEHLKTQRFLLDAPIKDVDRFMKRTLPARIRRGEVVYIRPDNPEPPTHGSTIWRDSPSDQGR